MKLRFLALIGVLVAGLVLAACGSSGGSSSSSSSTTESETTKGETGDASTAASKSEEPESNGEPLKIALLPPSTGALQVFGADEVKAYEFAADQVNSEGGVDGHEVEVTTEQTDGSPAATVSAAKKAVTQEGIHFLGGAMTSPEQGALNQQLEGLEAINFNSTATDDVLGEAQCSAWAVRTPQSVEMDVNTLAKLLPKFKAKSWAIQAVDYSTGHTSAETFAKAAEKAGDKVVLTQYAPLGTTEFGSYITKLNESGAEGLLMVEYGADGVAFVQQGAQFKMFEKFNTVIGFNTVSEPLFPVLGKTVLGFYNNIGYVHGLEEPMNKPFVEEWEAKYKESPYYVEADSYLAAQVLFEAVKKAGSIESSAVQEHLAEVEFESIVGPVKVRAGDNQLLRPDYVGQVVTEQGGAGGLGWKIVGEASAAETTGTEASPECQSS